MRKSKLLVGLLGIALVWLIPIGHAQQAVVYSTTEDYEQIKENLEFAITNQGLLIRGVMHIGTMLDNTRKDLGYDPVLLHGDAFEFCSAKFAYQMIKADPRNIVVCPFTVSVYVTLEQPQHTHIAYQVPGLYGENAAQISADIGALLDAIAQDAIAP